MGASVQQGGGGKTPTSVSDINVTPLVDVMLVLLIVFMVSAPMLDQGVEVDLPKAAAQVIDPPKEKVSLNISIDSKQRITVAMGDKADVVPPADLKNKLKMLIPGDPENADVSLRADASVQYGFVAQVSAAIRRFGVKKINLVTQQTEQQGEF